MSWISIEWSQLYRITDRDKNPWFNDVSLKQSKGHGVYRLVALQNETDYHPMPINRVCDTDSTGTIYLGAAMSLLGRIGDLVATHNPLYKSTKHRPLPATLAQMLPPERLAVCFQHVPENMSPFDKEHELMKLYYEKFGERPPLNRQG